MLLNTVTPKSDVNKLFRLAGRTGKPRKPRNNDESSSEEDDTNSVCINEEDEAEVAAEKAGNDVKAQIGNGLTTVQTEVAAKEPVPDIEDTVRDVEMTNRKLEALDKIK